jgi:hypothetical protein
MTAISTQVPYYVHLMLAQILDMDMSRIRVTGHMRRPGARTETLNELIARCSRVRWAAACA